MYLLRRKAKLEQIEKILKGDVDTLNKLDWKGISRGWL